ncbi:MAG: T9SS type A sorting domain-containing protein [Bacteroidetes bacterium]|nr:T9SS type A sorting domain-containing protein [Bacteroidota bacterium]
MKKIYLFIVICLSVLSLNGQSLTATNIYLSGDPLFFMEGHATITNVSAASKDVTVQRTVNNLFAGHNSYFCWVQCYGSQTSLAPDNITLAPGTNTDVFRGDLETNAISGISLVSYCFFDVNNTSDSVCVEYLYDATTGIGEVASGKNFISKPYPNPASSATNFYINVAKGAKNARLKFFNMLGAEVKDVAVTENRNSLKVNLTDLKSGIYFYSLLVDGKGTTTGKLMISRD